MRERNINNLKKLEAVKFYKKMKDCKIINKKYPFKIF